MKTLLAVSLSALVASAALANERPRKPHFSPSMTAKISRAAAYMRTQGAETETLVEREPAQFTIEPKDCSAVKTKITGKGIKKSTYIISMSENGMFHFDVREEASGTADDTMGNRYIWTYGSNVEFDSKTVPQPTPPFDLVGPDTFQLIPVTAGKGDAYAMIQYFRGTFAGDAPPIPVATTHPAACDPL